MTHCYVLELEELVNLRVRVGYSFSYQIIECSNKPVNNDEIIRFLLSDNEVIDIPRNQVFQHCVSKWTCYPYNTNLIWSLLKGLSQIKYWQLHLHPTLILTIDITSQLIGSVDDMICMISWYFAPIDYWLLIIWKYRNWQA